MIFPPINSAGLITQRPYKSGRTFKTIESGSPSSRPFSFGLYGSGLTNFPTKPLGKFELQYPAITDAELLTLRTFFETQAEGRLNEFVFIDPGGNLCTYSEDFTQSDWQKVNLTHTASGVSDPFGGNNAHTFQATGFFGAMYNKILPAGGASGYLLCASVWVKISAAQNFFVGFVDNSSVLLNANKFAVPANTWTRISNSVLLQTNDPIRMIVGGNSLWPTGTSVSLFGAQSCATGGPGAYRKTPGSDALHTKCRFDTDEFKFTAIGPNQNSVTLSVIEYY